MLQELRSLARRQNWPVPRGAHRLRAFDRHRQDRWRGFTLISVMLMVGLLFTVFGIALPAYSEAVDAARITQAIGDLRAIANEIMAYRIVNETVPDTLDEVGYGAHRDPYGNPYQYVKIDPGGEGGGGAAAARKDKFLVPINSLYDLYSKGRGGLTVAPLAAPQSWDDIVMANDGGYVGLGKDY